MIAVPLAVIGFLAVATLTGITIAHRRNPSPDINPDRQYTPLHAVTSPRTFQRPTLLVRARRVLGLRSPSQDAIEGARQAMAAAQAAWYCDGFELPRRKPMIDRPPWSTEPMAACTDQETLALHWGTAPQLQVQPELAKRYLP